MASTNSGSTLTNWVLNIEGNDQKYYFIHSSTLTNWVLNVIEKEKILPIPMFYLNELGFKLTNKIVRKERAFSSTLTNWVLNVRVTGL